MNKTAAVLFTEAKEKTLALVTPTWELSSEVSREVTAHTEAALLSAGDVITTVQNALNETSRTVYLTLAPFFEQTKMQIVQSFQEIKNKGGTFVATKDAPLADANLEAQPPSGATTSTRTLADDIADLKAELSRIKARGLVIETPAKLTERVIVEKPITTIIQGTSEETLEKKLEQLNNKLVAMIEG
ncbi:MAG: hypothetical protein HYT28_03025, partial [Parcubacteria group bacterium]|nr:hypothetical protein [Parcubacteria group bacterium]